MRWPSSPQARAWPRGTQVSAKAASSRIIPVSPLDRAMLLGGRRTRCAKAPRGSSSGDAGYGLAKLRRVVPLVPPEIGASLVLDGTEREHPAPLRHPPGRSAPVAPDHRDLLQMRPPVGTGGQFPL